MPEKNIPLKKLDQRLEQLENTYEPFIQRLLAEQPETFKYLSTEAREQALQMAFTIFGVIEPILVAFELPMEMSLDWLQEIQSCFSTEDPLSALRELSSGFLRRRDPVPVLATSLMLSFKITQPETIRVGLDALIKHIAARPRVAAEFTPDENNGCSHWPALKNARERADLVHEERRNLLHHLLICPNCHRHAAGSSHPQAPGAPVRFHDARSLTCDPFVMVLRRLQTAWPERLRAAHREALEDARERPLALLHLLLEEALQLVYDSKDFRLEVMGLVLELLRDFRLPLVDAEKRHDLLALAEFYLAETYRLLQQAGEATKALERGQEARKQGAGNLALKATFYQISARLPWAELYPGASAERLLLEAEQYLWEERYRAQRVEVLHELAGVWIGQQRFGKARGVLCKAKAFLDTEEAVEETMKVVEEELTAEKQEIMLEQELSGNEEEGHQWPLLRLVNYHHLAVVELGVAEKTTREPQRQVCLKRANEHLAAAEPLYEVYGSQEFREQRDLWLAQIERLSAPLPLLEESAEEPPANAGWH